MQHETCDGARDELALGVALIWQLDLGSLVSYLWRRREFAPQRPHAREDWWAAERGRRLVLRRGGRATRAAAAVSAARGLRKCVSPGRVGGPRAEAWRPSRRDGSIASVVLPVSKRESTPCDDHVQAEADERRLWLGRCHGQSVRRLAGSRCRTRQGTGPSR